MKERTLVLLKPDIILRGITGEIIMRFEKAGLKITAMKMLIAERESLQKHYFKDDEWLAEKGEMRKKNKAYPQGSDPKEAGREIVNGLVNDMMISPIIAMILEGNNAVNTVRKLTGPTNIEDAAPGTIRGDYSHDTFSLSDELDRPLLTIIHASDSVETAETEISLWFTSDEIFEYTRCDENVHYRQGK